MHTMGFRERQPVRSSSALMTTVVPWRSTSIVRGSMCDFLIQSSAPCSKLGGVVRLFNLQLA